MVTASLQSIGRRYFLHHKIGSGGMGAVFQATDRLMGQTVALKRLLTASTASDTDAHSISLRLSISREFQTLASLRHPNVINVLDYGFDEEKQPYFTMPFLDQATNVRQAGVNRPIVEKVRLLIQLLQALVYMHRQGIIHRDLKPDNVLVTQDGQVKVLDFGVALRKGVDIDEFAGTPMYIAPEIWLGGTPTASSDLYAVGVIAYELFAGRSPFPFKGDLQSFLSIIVSTLPDMSPIEAITPDLVSTVIDPSPNDETAQGTLLLDTIQGDISATFVLKNDLNPDLDTTAPATLTLPVNQTFDVPPPDTAQSQDSSASLSGLTEIIGKLLAKQSYQRYSNAEEVITALRAFIGEPEHAESTDIRESFLQAAKFVGRDAEIKILTEALNDLTHQQGSLWLIGGESGVGKSRLLDELRIEAIVQGSLALRGQAVGEGSAPYQLWLDPLRRLILSVDVDETSAGVLQQIVPDIRRLVGHDIMPAPELEGKAAEQRLLLAIKSLFQSYFSLYTDGIVVILEDLQWASKDLEVVKVLTPLLDDYPLLLLGSYRQDENPRLAEELPGSHVLKLNRLDSDQVAELSASILGEAGSEPEVVKFLQRETEGNVFFLVEVIRALAEEAGQLDRIANMTLRAGVFAHGIQRIIQRRLEHIPAMYRPLLNLAAVAGRQLDLFLLGELADGIKIDEWLTACVNAAVLDSQDERWRFAHDKLREAVLANLPPEQRGPLHWKVAEGIESLYSETIDQHVHALAYLWSQTNNRAKELLYSQMAGKQALHLDAYADARRLLARSLELIETSGTAKYRSQEIEVNIALGKTYEYVGSYDQAKKHLSMGLTLATTADGYAQVAEALVNLGWISMREGNPDGARTFSMEAAIAASKVNSREQWVKASYLTALTHLVKGEYALAADNLAECLPVARELNDQRNVANILNALGGIAEGLGNFTEAHQYLREGSDIASKIGFKILAANIEGNMGHLTYNQQLFLEAKVHFERALVLFREIGNIFGEASVLADIGFIELEWNHDFQALPYLQRAVATSASINAIPVTLKALCGMGRLWSRVRREDKAVEVLTFALNHPASGSDNDIEKCGRPVLTQLETDLEPARFSAAVERGRTWELADIVTEVAAYGIH